MRMSEQIEIPVGQELRQKPALEPLRVFEQRVACSREREAKLQVIREQLELLVPDHRKQSFNGPVCRETPDRDLERLMADGKNDLVERSVAGASFRAEQMLREDGDRWRPTQCGS